MVKNLIQNQKTNKHKCQYECKNPIKHNLCDEDYGWNLSTCAVLVQSFNKKLRIYGYMKSLIDGSVITCDEILDTPKTVSINSNNKKQHEMDYYILCTFLLVTISSLKIVLFFANIAKNIGQK